MTPDNHYDILVAEDSPTQAERLKYSLEQHGYSVRVAPNGKVALEQARQRRPDLIISDIVMPELDGYGLSRAIKNDDTLADVPVILLTSLSDLEDVIKGLECGADSFIRKSNNMEYLFPRMDALLKNAESRLEHATGNDSEVFFDGRRYAIGSKPQQIFDLLVSIYEQAVFMNREMEKSNEELERARQEAESANISKSQFLANMSHELRTPLNAIIGYSEMLAEDAEDNGNQPMGTDLGKILSSGRHLLGLINDVLDLSKIEAGRMDLYAESFSVANLLEEVGATVAPMLEARGNALRIDCSEEVGDMHSDLTKVRQILTNLLSNAVKFTAEGKIVLAASLGQIDDYDSLVFSVSDTGIGMNEDQLTRVFEVFAQADTSTTREYGGTGLGLAISRQLADLLGGEISVVSKPGEGTTFSVELPLRLEVAAGEEEAVYRPQSLPPEKIDRAEESVDSDGQNTVLLIDDDAHARELLGIYLQRSGWHVIAAADALAGIELAREVEPAVIIHDIMMPGMDGWSLLDVLKNDVQLRDIPVIVCSVMDESGRGIAQGAVDYLVKPVSKEKLIQTLGRFKSRI